MTTAAIFATREVSWRPSFYRGEQFDSDLGLYYLRARYYNPVTGRFLSRDPEDGKILDPATLHKYLYASGDPVNSLDPTGRDTTITKPKGGLGGAIGEWADLVQNIALYLGTLQAMPPWYFNTPRNGALALAGIAVMEQFVAVTCDFESLIQSMEVMAGTRKEAPISCDQL
jgi:RHS repeat-associated protein